MKITKEMIKAVMDAMAKGIMQKGAPNKFLTLEQIEAYMLEQGIDYFVPVRNTLNGLIKKGYVRYFTLENGRTTFGFSKKVQLKYFPDKAESIQRTTATPTVEMDEEINRMFDAV